MSGPVLRWPGAKWTLAPWILDHLPPHDAYLEPYFGSGAVFFTKTPTKYETINDRDAQIINLFRILRDRPADLERVIALTPWSRDEYELSYGPPTGDPLEDARQFLVRCWQAFGATTGRRTGWRNDVRAGRNVACPDQWSRLPERIRPTAERLRNAHVENRPALELLARANATDVLVYADPPYLTETRAPDIYANEMTDADHADLLDALDAHRGPVVLSGYANDLYDARLAGWSRLERRALADGGRERLEILWLNPTAVQRLRPVRPQAALWEVA